MAASIRIGVLWKAVSLANIRQTYLCEPWLLMLAEISMGRKGVPPDAQNVEYLGADRPRRRDTLAITTRYHAHFIDTRAVKVHRSSEQKFAGRSTGK